MKPNSLWLIGAVLFVSCQALFAQTHSNGAVSKADYKLGQVWTTSQGITVTILAIEDFKKVGTVVHVRVGLPRMAREKEARNSEGSLASSDSSAGLRVRPRNL